MKELGIYVHIPFCKQKCYYCDFISYANKANLADKYVCALEKEIEHSKEHFKEDATIKTIYIGGGTPSYIDSKHIIRLLDKIKNEFNVDKKAEITIEVNPGTVNKDKLQDYFNAGINRVSIGLQTTNDKILKDIGRIHNYNEFLKCYNLAKEVGFENINVDLIFALPNQTLDNVKEDVENILKLKVNHISLYSLILEENTYLYSIKNSLKLPEDEEERQMYWYIKKCLQDNGYLHYEISNFAKKGYESKHNTMYWNQGEYIGLGAAAHSYVNNTRYSNINNLEEYISNIENNNFEHNITINEEQTILEDKIKEYIILKLRMLDGIDVVECNDKFNIDILDKFKTEISKLQKENLIYVDDKNIRLTDKGLDLANIVWEEFI